MSWIPSPEEIRRRRHWIAYLREEGASYQQIAQCLGIAKHFVNHDITILGLTNEGRVSRMDPPPDPVPDWRDREPPRVTRLPKRSTTRPRLTPPPQVPLYQRSTTLQLCHDFVRVLRNDNAVNRLSHDALQADEYGDLQWYEEARRILASTRTYLDRLDALLDDEAARQRGANDWRERDDLQNLPNLIRLRKV